MISRLVTIMLLGTVCMNSIISVVPPASDAKFPPPDTNIPQPLPPIQQPVPPPSQKPLKPLLPPTFAPSPPPTFAPPKPVAPPKFAPSPPPTFTPSPKSKYVDKGFVYRQGLFPFETNIRIDPNLMCIADTAILITNPNGTCHNLAKPSLGISFTTEFRPVASLYADDKGSVITNRPSPRLLSNTLVKQVSQKGNIKQMSSLLIYFAQFVDHDTLLIYEQPENGKEEVLDLTGGQPIPNDIPTNPEFIRSDFKFSPKNIRDFLNTNTAWLDLSQVYGDTKERSIELRIFQNGLLKTTIEKDVELLPFIDGEFFCGDTRCEEHLILSSLHTIFLREHNRLAREYQKNNPKATDEDIYQNARFRNILQYQSIVWDFYLPYIFGRRTFSELTGPYQGFQSTVSPIPSLVYSSAAYRYGHSGIGNNLLFLNTNLQPARPSIELREAFFVPEVILETPSVIEELMLGHSTLVHPVLDIEVVDGLRNFLFANVDPNGIGFDLIARNIQRARDHGVSTFNLYRQQIGLNVITCPENDQFQCFFELTADEELAQRFASVYTRFDDVDVWLAGMGEKPYEDSDLGETFTRIILEQFNRYRTGDRSWYERLAPKFPELNFPVRLNTILERNFQAIQYPSRGANGIDSAFATENVYIAILEATRYQVEWVIPFALENRIDAFLITANVNRVVVPKNQLYFFSEGQNPGTPYIFTVDAQIAGIPDVRIGDIQFTLLLE